MQSHGICDIMIFDDLKIEYYFCDYKFEQNVSYNKKIMS